MDDIASDSGQAIGQVTIYTYVQSWTIIMLKGLSLDF